jgi:hypothetical protein
LGFGEFEGIVRLFHDCRGTEQAWQVRNGAILAEDAVPNVVGWLQASRHRPIEDFPKVDGTVLDPAHDGPPLRIEIRTESPPDHLLDSVFGRLMRGLSLDQGEITSLDAGASRWRHDCGR